MMNKLITSNTRRLGKVLVALIVAVAALVLLLSTWSSLPTAEARGPAEANTGGTDLLLSSRSLLTYYVFLPILFKSDKVFFDDFSDSSSGWPHKKSFEDCHYEYRNGHYQVRVTDNGQRCIIPNFSIPSQVDGTFIVKARRTSDEKRHMLYGLIFGAGVDATEDRWALEVFPNDDPDCSDKPFYWLYALVDGNRKYFRDRCTDAIDPDEDDWNELKVIRNGKNIKVYLNGESKGEYNDANYLLNKGFTLLEVVSVSDSDIVVEFDDFQILQETSP
jgi:hypothetical protein